MAGNILTALSSGVNLANSLMNEQIKINNELTEADYKSQSYEFNDAFKSMMMDFENRPDYENFQQEYDDFFEQWKNTVNTNAKTGASAKALSDMVDNTYQQYKFGLQQSVLNSQRNAVMTLHNEEIERTKQDTLISTEDKVSNILDINNQDYRSGNFASAQAYEQKTISDITDVILTDSKDIGLNILAAGGSLEDAINAAYTGADKDLKITMLQAGTLVDEDRSGSLNRDGIKSQLRKELTTYYNTVVTEKQNQNEQKLSQQYSTLLQLSGNDLLNGVMKAFEDLNGMTGNALKAEDRDKYARYYKNLLDSIETGDGTTKTGNSAVKTTMFTDILTDDNLFPFFQAAANGNYDDLYCMKEAIKNADYAYTREQYKEIYGKDLSIDDYMAAKGKALNSVFDKLEKSGLLPSEAYTVVKKSKNILNTMIQRNYGMSAEKYFEGKGEYYDVVIGKVEDLALDLVWQCNIGDQAQLDKLIPDFENRLNAMFLDGLDFTMTRKWGESQDAVLARTVDALSDEASAYTYEGKTNYAPGAKNAKDSVQESLKDKVYDATGISKDQLTPKDDISEHDMTANPILSDNKGNHYKYATKDGKLVLMVKREGKDWEELQNNNVSAADESEMWKGVDESTRNVIERKVATGTFPDLVPVSGSSVQLTQMSAQKWNLLSDQEKKQILLQMATSNEPLFVKEFKKYLNK